MPRKSGTILMGLFVVLFSGVNMYFYFNRDNPRSPISGAAISELPLGINMSVFAFILQWVILLMVVLFAYMKFLKHRKEEEEKVANFIIPQPKSRSETNIDIFYNLLKEKKSLSTGAIAKAFKIPKETALEWAKILEDHEMINIEYPAFSDPEVMIKGLDDKKEIQGKTLIKPKSLEENKGKSLNLNENKKQELKIPQKEKQQEEEVAEKKSVQETTNKK